MSHTDDWENKTFPNGRHRNKTYLHVFQNDEEFCKMVLKGEQSPFIPEDFKDFLLTRQSLSKQIEGQRCSQFLKALTPEIRKILKTIIGDIEMRVEVVHPPCTKISNTFIGRFYQLFIQKCVFNLIDSDGYFKFVDNYASIFPFHVSSEIGTCEVGIWDVFDQKLWNEMQKFLDQHFDDVKIRSISHVLFANIMNFKEKNFSEETLSKILKNSYIRGLSLRNDENEVSRRSRRVEEKCDYLKDFPRLNNYGTFIYEELYNTFVSVFGVYGKPCVISADKYSSKYLKKLPEINFYELYSLLDPKFLRTNRREYVYRFQKYLFFFINALNSESKPVFFVDDALFECMKSLRAFRKSRDDVFSLMYELAAISVILLRKHPSHSCETADIDEENLQHVKEYVQNIPNISTAVVNYEVNTDILESTVLISTEDTCIEACISNKRRNKLRSFYELILHGALSPKNIKRLVIYNAFYGEECSIAMPENKEALVEFIRTYNHYDFSKPPPPEKFITQEGEKFFQGDVANWDSRSVYKAF